MAEPPASPRVVLSFGRFELRPAERSLSADGVRVEMGARTLDMLIALASRPNQALGKRQLMAEVWPDVTVDEGSLRFHITKLRKALGDGRNGARYIATLAGRGYCFVAPVSRSDDRAKTAAAFDPAATFLPARLEGMLGRDDDVRAIAEELTRSRFVTLVGAGGVGKTTVAIAVAHDLLAEFDGAALFVDFSLLNNPRMASSSVASMLGLSIRSDDPTPDLIGRLRDSRMLLVLDNCEHVIEGVSGLATQILRTAPRLHILATSREPLRVESEHVRRLAPLGVPPDDPALTTAAALTFPAAQLFVERATASGARLDLTDANAAALASICRKLDGMALAIELAAGRVEAFGLQQTAAILDQRFTRLWSGKRTAPARQRTLQATLDWSYGLLPETEREVLRRLAVFVGPFGLEAALAVVASETLDVAQVFAAIDSLVAKSMLVASPAGSAMRYRLLDITRAYVLEIAAENGELAGLAARHASHCEAWLQQTATMWPTLPSPTQRASLLVDLNNVRAALDWCFGDGGAVALGVALAAAAAPVFFALSMLTDCQRWSQRAISTLDDATKGSREEMRLQAALGLALMWTQGNSPAAQAALNRSLAIAEQLGETLNQIQLLAPLHVYNLRIGRFRTARQYADHVAALSQTLEDPTATALSRILSGYSLHFEGELRGAQRELEAALRHQLGRDKAREPSHAGYVMMNSDAMAAPILTLAWSAAPSALARTLWLQGCPNEAVEYAKATVTEAARTEHSATLPVALMYAISVLLWNGDHVEAEAFIGRFRAIAGDHALPSYAPLGACFQAQLAIRRGDAAAGLRQLRPNLEELRAQRYDLFTTAFALSLVEALALTGDIAAAATRVHETIRAVEVAGDLCYLPELLRVKAELLLSPTRLSIEHAELCLAQSLELSRRQGARAWELRTSIDLAKRSAAQGRPEQARELLRPVCDQFAAGAVSADLQTARRLLASWD